MSPGKRPLAPDRHLTSWSHRLKKAVALRVRAHLIETVIATVVSVWLGISLAVLHVEREIPGANITTFGRAIWWSTVTLLTVGYGDLYPVTTLGRVLAGFLMLSGVMGIAVMTSKLSSTLLEQRLRERTGLVNSNKLKDHFIICGWKEDMGDLLMHILDFNPGMDSADLLMIAAVKPQIVSELHENPRLKNLQVILGNYYDAATLKRAAPERAMKVLLLADRTPGATGVVPSMNEVDARTIMTAMTLSNIARGTLVTAEILDPKMDQYLKLAQVSEIIYSREYSRLLLGNASGGTGIANIIFDLLDSKTDSRISTAPIADQWVGSAYAEFKREHEARETDEQVIGVLENTGNTHRIKELALRQAQKTPDMAKLLENLRLVKELKCNHPVFSPGADYRIPEGAMAIVITTIEKRRAHVASEKSTELSTEIA